MNGLSETASCVGGETDACLDVGAEPQLDDKDLLRLYLKGKRGPEPSEAMVAKVAGERFGFSWLSFLLGPFYFVYRKLYLAAAVVFLILLAYLLVPFEVPGFVFSLAYGLLFYSLCASRARKAVAAAKEAGLAEGALARLAATGGTSLPAALASLAGYIAVVALVLAGAYSGLPGIQGALNV